MKTINVKATTPYDILIGKDILQDIGAYVAKLQNKCKIAIISDDKVLSYYGNTIKESCVQQGFTVIEYAFKNGEEQKNINTVNDIYMFLAKANFTRCDLIIALGGGVVGDMAGFVAATYMRGVDYMQVPTTLLAQIDSSIGGKTAIDLPLGKNLVGCFYQPKMVYIDINTLDSLDDINYLNGIGEGIKYAVLNGGRVLDICKDDIKKNILDFIVECILIKKEIVEKDEKESGERKLLNLGHTFGHSIEVAENFKVPHGICVAIGLEIVAKINYKKGLLGKDNYELIMLLLEKYGLNKHKTYCYDSLIDTMKIDKKVKRGKITFVMPYAVGDCRLIDIELDNIGEYINE